MSDNGDGETLRLTELERLIICVICVICVGQMKVKVICVGKIWKVKVICVGEILKVKVLLICVGENIFKVKVQSLKRLYYIKTCFRERFHTQKVRCKPA